MLRTSSTQSVSIPPGPHSTRTQSGQGALPSCSHAPALGPVLAPRGPAWTRLEVVLGRGHFSSPTLAPSASPGRSPRPTRHAHRSQGAGREAGFETIHSQNQTPSQETWGALARPVLWSQETWVQIQPLAPTSCVPINHTRPRGVVCKLGTTPFQLKLLPSPVM